MLKRMTDLCAVVTLGCAFLAGFVAPRAHAGPARQVVVAQDGSGQFKSIVDAVAAAENPTQDSPVDIVIKPGTYEETITTRDWVNLVGEDRDKCIITYSAPVSEVDQAAKYHTIWATTNTVIKNLSIIGGIVKYCIHSDGGRPYVLTLENCLLRRDMEAYPKDVSEGRRTKPAFGIGLWSDQHIIMKDCKLVADVPIYMHNSYRATQPCSMTLEKCELRGKDRALWIICMGSLQRDFFVIHDSVLDGGPSQVAVENLDNAGKPGYAEGKGEIALLGSGNDAKGKNVNIEMTDDSKDRRSGMERARQAGAATLPSAAPAASAAAPAQRPVAGATLNEDYGTAPDKIGKVADVKGFIPYEKGKYYMAAEFTDNSLVLTCPPVAENPEDFSAATGPSGDKAAIPIVWEARMKFTYATGGSAQMYYCWAPRGWLIAWQPDKVRDTSSTGSLAVDTTAWQTYRVVARSLDDVRLFVEGQPGDGVKLTAFDHPGKMFQFRLLAHGTRCEVDWWKVYPADGGK